MRFKKLLVIHIIIWIFYFGGIGYYIDVFWYGEAENKNMYWLHWSASRFGDMAFSYFLVEIIFQKFFSTKKYIWFGIALIAFSLFHYTYDTWVWNWFSLDYVWTAADPDQRSDIIGNVIQITMISVIFYSGRNWEHSYFLRKKLEDELAQTELKFLKSQMSPHFLFNVFNNIYSLSLDENPKTHKAIGQLKSIMNYIQIFESKEEITLAEEKYHLQHYIDLNRLRHTAKVRLKSSFENPELKIEPMILLPFFENAFKHGKTGENDDIRAIIKERGGVVNFEISNEINPNKRKDSVSGVGLENIKKRLPYLYSDFLIEVIQDEEKYKVKMRLNLGKKIKL